MLQHLPQFFNRLQVPITEEDLQSTNGLIQLFYKDLWYIKFVESFSERNLYKYSIAIHKK